MPSFGGESDCADDLPPVYMLGDEIGRVSVV